ncbi:tetratricopeptide repeat protein [Nonomuraea deserti]|uniref:Tetratricopeptide repeat protein n=1 Tax=Nonomuraea deserti TaxID=1848322 RepID=A0A4R4W9M1_9ACTN|nr:tetratricopeptide repeat protein [Nonomuraea deserti]TDD11935.1 tetratricopeptide repeat protein [Nonomuraea deserti]
MSRTRRLPPLLGCVLLGGVLLALYAPGGVLRRDEPPPGPAGRSPYDLSGSIEDAQDRLRHRPDDAAIWASLGLLYLEQGRRTADGAYYGKAQGAFERSLRLPTGDGEPYIDAVIGMGALANARHDFAGAVRWAERAREAAPYRWPLYGVLTDAYLELGQYERAERALRRMLDGRPDLASFTRAARLEQLHGRTGPARRLLLRACEIAGAPAEYAFCQWQLGELSWNGGDARGALAAYTRALAADPGHVPSRAGKARAEAALGHLDQARHDYATVVTRSPSSVVEYGELLEHLGDRAAARRQYAVFTAQHKLLAAGGNADDLAMGTYEANHGDPEAAVRHLRAEWRRRRSVVVADALGWALHKAGRHAEAAEYAARAARLGGHDALFAYHRGEIERALGHTESARAHLTRALSINPHFSPAGAARARALLAATA